MRPQKLSREQLLQYCMPVFKQHGYQGTSMAMLASACDLTKGAFYYEYQDKESLVADMLSYVHQLVDHKLFSLVYEAGTVQMRYQRLHEQAVKFFSQGGMGCLMAVIGGEARYLSPSLLGLTRQFLSRWQQTMQVLFDEVYPKAQADALAKQSVADYEGAILLGRIYDDPSYLQAVYERIDAQLASKPVLAN